MMGGAVAATVRMVKPLGATAAGIHAITLALVLGGCSCGSRDDYTASPCYGVDCGPNGACGTIGAPDGEPVCVCDPGFHAEGLACIQDVDLCAGVECSGNGSCALLAGEPVCVCDDGYVASGLECLAVPDPCAFVLCSYHGECAILDGEAVCICDAGWRAEGTDCVDEDPYPCSGHYCSFRGECMVVDGEPICVCEDGYVAVGLACQAVPACEGITCSYNGHCAILGVEPVCICDEGFYNPWPLDCMEGHGPFVGFCTADGWCRRNPLPMGSDLRGVWGSDADDVWSVGGDGTIVHWNGSAWWLESGGTGRDLHGVSGTDPDHVWVVGEAAGSSLILGRGAGGAWTAAGPSVPGGVLRDVWAAAADDVWAAGDRSVGGSDTERLAVVQRFDGAGWQDEDIDVEGILSGVWAADGEAWAVGWVPGATIEEDVRQIVHRRTDGAWEVVETGGSGRYTDIWGWWIDDIWVTGTDCDFLAGQCTARITHWNGAEWDPVECMNEGMLMEIWGTAPGDAWAVGLSNVHGEHGRMAYHLYGDHWQTIPASGRRGLLGVWSTAGSDIWVVGESGLVIHSDDWASPSWGWHEVSMGSVYDLRDVSGTGATDVWAAGFTTIVRFDGDAWTTDFEGSKSLRGIWAAGADDIWAVGDLGKIMHRAGDVWSDVPSGTSEDLLAVHGTFAGDAWASGSGGAFLGLSGVDWTPIASVTAARLNAVWATGAGDAWAAGDGGTLLRFEGGSWTDWSPGVPSDLIGLWGSGPDDVWAVGEAGTVLRWDGVSWTPVDGPPGFVTLRGVSGSPVGEVRVAGEGGTIFLWDGAEWVEEDSGTTDALDGIWHATTGQAWVVGQNGAILVKNP